MGGWVGGGGGVCVYGGGGQWKPGHIIRAN